jgi:uncharacterized protein
MMMRHSFRPCLAFVLAGALLLGAAGQAAAAETPKQKDIRKLLLLTGSDKLGTQVLVQMLAQFKAMPQFKKVPPKFWDDFQKEASVNDLIDLIVPIYDRHLSHPEVKAIIKFYESPSGRKFTSVLPAITQESMVAGQAWGQALGQKIAERMKKKGYDK